MATIRDLVEQIADQLGNSPQGGGGSTDLAPVLQRLDALGPMVADVQAKVAQIQADLEGQQPSPAPTPAPAPEPSPVEPPPAPPVPGLFG